MTKLTLVRRIAARPSILFAALTEPEGIASWWGPDAGPVLHAETAPHAGGNFRVRFRMLDGTEHESAGEFLEIDPPHFVAMSWRWLAGGDDPGESRLEFRLRPIPEGTELTLTHARLQSEAARASHASGWEGALNKLERRFQALAEGTRNDPT